MESSLRDKDGDQGWKGDANGQEEVEEEEEEDGEYHEDEWSSDGTSTLMSCDCSHPWDTSDDEVEEKEEVDDVQKKQRMDAIRRRQQKEQQEKSLKWDKWATKRSDGEEVGERNSTKPKKENDLPLSRKSTSTANVRSCGQNAIRRRAKVSTWLKNQDVILDGDCQRVEKVINNKGIQVSVLMRKSPENCVTCGEVFDRKSRAMIHFPCYTKRTGIKGSGEKGVSSPYKCEFCPKSFTELSYLRGHIAYHVDTGLFKCIDCGIFTCAEGGAARHTRVHSGHRPYQCKHCDKAFTQTNVLNDHVRIHTGEKPFRCLWPECGKRFASTSLRADHVLRFHRKLKSHLCPVIGCNLGFVTTYEVTRHVKKNHAGIMLPQMPPPSRSNQ